MEFLFIGFGRHGSSVHLLTDTVEQCLQDGPTQCRPGTKARLDGTKLKELSWAAKYDIQSVMRRTIRILAE